MSAWRSLISSVEYAPAQELTQGLSSIIDSFNQTLADPPAELRAPSRSWTDRQAALLLTPSPRSDGFSTPLNGFSWTDAVSMQMWLWGTLIGAATCLTQAFVKARGDGQMLEIIEHPTDIYSHPFLTPELPGRTAWTFGFLVISGEHFRASRTEATRFES